MLIPSVNPVLGLKKKHLKISLTSLVQVDCLTLLRN